MAEVFHISEEAAVLDLKALFDYVRAGDDAVVEFAGERVAVTRLDHAGELKGVRQVQPPASDDERILEQLLARSKGSSTSESSGPGRTAEEIIRSLSEWQAKHGKLVMDEDFADDLEDIHRLYNQPLDGSKWD